MTNDEQTSMYLYAMQAKDMDSVEVDAALEKEGLNPDTCTVEQAKEVLSKIEPPPPPLPWWI